jgi:dolichyl-phosphate beta-glucosyltransferase
MYLSVIIPAYNEEKNIEQTIRSIFNYLKLKNIEHEILVVTDGSTDNTKSIVKSLIPEIPTLNLISFKENRGKGYVVKMGMIKAKGDFKLFTDADNSTSIDNIEKMMPYFNKGYDVVIASIGVTGKQILKGSEPLWRKLFGKLGNLYIRLLVTPGIYDTQRGFKIFTAKAADKIFPKLTIERWGFDVEVLALANKFGFKIKEVPVVWQNNINTSHVKLSAYFQVLLEVLKIKWNLLINKYDKI